MKVIEKLRLRSLTEDGEQSLHQHGKFLIDHCKELLKEWNPLIVLACRAINNQCPDCWQKHALVVISTLRWCCRSNLLEKSINNRHNMKRKVCTSFAENYGSTSAHGEIISKPLGAWRKTASSKWLNNQFRFTHLKKIMWKTASWKSGIFNTFSENAFQE